MTSKPMPRIPDRPTLKELLTPALPRPAPLPHERRKKQKKDRRAPAPRPSKSQKQGQKRGALSKETVDTSDEASTADAGDLQERNKSAGRVTSGVDDGEEDDSGRKEQEKGPPDEPEEPHLLFS